MRRACVNLYFASEPQRASLSQPPTGATSDAIGQMNS
jgi:hypothetical protein